jgi:hypothetical protein
VTAPTRQRRTPKDRAKKPTTAGDRLRESITSEFELSEPEAQLLAKACATADLLERVEAEVAAAPLIRTGSRGQPVSNPLIATQVELGWHLVRLLEALGVPVGGGEDPGDAEVSRQARRAAMVRWHGGRR